MARGDSCSGCGTHTGMHWPDCPFGSEPNYSANQLTKTKKAIGEEISNAQAELQTAIGFLRMMQQPDYTAPFGLDEIEKRMIKSLEIQQAVLWDHCNIKMVAEAERRGQWKDGKPV